MDPSQVAWCEYDTAYGSAEPVGPLIAALFGEDDNAAGLAVSELEGYLCHQHVQIASAAAPALPFLLDVLPRCSYDIADELLFVLLGFAKATEAGFWSGEPPSWMASIEAGMRKGASVIRPFQNVAIYDVAFYASEIIRIVGSEDNAHDA